MSREIKFRQAVYSEGKFHHWHKWGFLPNLTFVGPDSVNGLAHALANSQQYTGKHDNDGKEICAGDICRNGDWEEDAHAWNYRIEEVIWDSCNAGWLGWNDTERGCCCNIVGNIHQHPELLEGT